MRKRSGEPWLPAATYGRTLTGLSVNLIVRDVARSLPFYTEVLGFRAAYSHPDFAALERESVRLTLHVDHAYEGVPWVSRLTGKAGRGTGAEIRILGVDPDAVAQAARERGSAVLYGPLTKATRLARSARRRSRRLRVRGRSDRRLDSPPCSHNARSRSRSSSCPRRSRRGSLW